MRIPSYDDLTPSIPDVSAGDVLTSAAGLLPDGGPVAVRAVRSGGPACQLFAALHGGSPERLLTIARDFSPRLERHPGGTIVLDVAGLQRLLGAPPAIAADLAAAGTPRVAVAVSQIAAILLARARAGITVETGQPETALGDVPIAVLQQWLADRAGASVSPGTPGRRSTRALPSAAGARAFDVLRRWGLTTLGELAALPAAALSARLGPEGIAMQRLARGIDARPLVPDPGVPRFLDSFELEWPIDTLEPLSFVFARVLDPLAVALERADRGAVAIHLTLRLTDRTSHARTLQLPVAMRDPRALRTLLLLDLESHPPSAAADVVTIELDPAPARIVQYSLLDRAVPSPETLATLMARLGALVGGGRCGSPVLLDTYRPDGFVMAPVSFEEARRTTTPVHLPTPMPPGVDDQGDSRRMTPLPVDGSRFGSTRSLSESGVGSWELTSERCVLRRFRPPVAVRVAVEAGRPGRIAIDRRGMPGGAVRQAAGPWRTSGGWWEHGRWNRDEWDVALSDGTVGRLFRDRDSGIWFFDGVYD